MYWYEKASFYHIYPLGYFGCPKENDYKIRVGNIRRLIPRIPELKRLGFNAIYFGPLFDSVAHGYDTVDYTKIDPRLGTNADFAEVTAALHEAGISVVVDGVFNHVGRNFKQFKDVRDNRNSVYKDWFYIRDGNSNYNDGFWYEGWEGHFELVKLNLQNPAVRDYLKSCVSGWIDEFGIDGIRLDVAYCLDLQFLRELRSHCKAVRDDFWLMGETLHGDYNKWMNPEMLDSVTNYECYKGLWSSFNSVNLFEIAHSIRRQEGLYHGKKMFTFLDNHDVTRIFTQLTNKNHVYPLYTLLYTMLGIPSVYYGSEYGQEGDKERGDDNLRPEFVQENYDSNTDVPQLLPQGQLLPWRQLLPALIAKLTRFRRMSAALAEGEYRELHLECSHYAFERVKDGERVVVCINAGNDTYSFNVDLQERGADCTARDSVGYVDVISGRTVRSPVEVPPCSAVAAVNRPALVRDIYVDIAACGGVVGEVAASTVSGAGAATTSGAASDTEKVKISAAAKTNAAKLGKDTATPEAAAVAPGVIPPAEKISRGQLPPPLKAETATAPSYGVGKKQAHALYDFSVLLDGTADSEAVSAAVDTGSVVPVSPPQAVKISADTSREADVPVTDVSVAEVGAVPLPKEGIVSRIVSVLKKPGRVKAVLLDMDGTVLDTEPIHLNAWREAFKDDAIHYPDGFLESWVGMSEPLMMKTFYKQYRDTELFYRLRYKMAIHNRKLCSDGIPVKAGFDTLADYASANDIRLYVVTSSFAGAAARDLKTACIFGKISGIIGCDDVDNGKPNPEAYLRGLQLAGAGREDCLAVEDSSFGIKAAVASGIETVYVPDIAEVASDVAATAKYRCEDLSGVVDVIMGRK